MPPAQEGTQPGCPGVLSPHQQGAGALVDGGWGGEAVAGEWLLPGPRVSALLGDPGSDDFMALLRTNFHPGRENKRAGLSFAVESYWGRGELLPVFIHGPDFSIYLHGMIIPKSQ